MNEPKYKTIKKWLKSKIIDGSFKPNQKIHSESELMDQFSVSRHTVRVALGELESEGWLYKIRGSGTYVSEVQPQKLSNISHKNIAIITTYISDYIFPSIIRGAEKVLSKEGYQVSLFSTNNDHEIEKMILESVLTQRFEGVIVEPTKSAMTNPNINYYLELEAMGVPYIMINAAYEELEPISITIDDEKGGYLQTEHLIKLGHTNILGFFKNDDLQGIKRMKGYLKAHREYGIPIRPQNIITYHTDEKESKPAAKLREILKSHGNIPSGIVCYNDELAMSLLNILREENYKIPENISVVGFDNSFFAEVSDVKLTTIQHPKSVLGEKAAQTIVSMINRKKEMADDQAKINSFVFEPTLVERNSTDRV